MIRQIIIKKFASTIFLALGFCIVSNSNAQQKDYNILDYGAVADGKTINTSVIQKVIEIAAENKGVVYVPNGKFYTGTLYLKNHTIIRLADEAVLLGSHSFSDYPDNYPEAKNNFTYSNKTTSRKNHALLYAERKSDISILGYGTINGNGDNKVFNLGEDGGDNPLSRERPCLILFINCKNIQVQHVSLTQSAYWMQNYIGCDGIYINDIKVFNHANLNNDAIDIDSKNVIIENSFIDSDDDGICLKSHDQNKICENVIIRNCTIASNCNAIKMGTASIGGFNNVSISNCIIHNASVSKFRFWDKVLKFIDQPITTISGIALEMVDGGYMQNIQVNNITMKDVQTPIFVVLGNRNTMPVGDTSDNHQNYMRNIIMQNITATAHSKMSSSITAYPGQYVENLTLNNINFINKVGGTKEDAKMLLPENSKTYPENRMYGLVYPSSGLFLRHVKNINLQHLIFKISENDFRPNLIMDDVIYANISGINYTVPPAQLPVVLLNNCNYLKFEGIYFNSMKTKVAIQGNKTGTILFSEGNGNRKFIVLSKEVNDKNIIVQ